MLFNYTTELRTFFENLPANSDMSLPHSQVIENGRPVLFNFNYPFFDADYKKVFETNFIRKFYMREIGFETFGLFKFQLETWLIINMPYFNKMFESELLQYDPLTNTKTNSTYNKKNTKEQNETRNTTDTKTIEGETNNTTNRIGSTDNEETSSSSGNTDSQQNRSETSSENGDSFNRKLESNNPDSRLSISTEDGQGIIEYASGINEDTGKTNKSNTASGTGSSSESSRVDSANKGKTMFNDELEDNGTTNITQNDTKNDSLQSSINDTEDYVQYKVGKIGIQSYPKMVQEYRNALLRIENQIFDEMQQLFMLVY